MKEFLVPETINKNDLKKIRKKLGLTQAEFAKLCNVSQKTVERWEASGSEKLKSFLALLWNGLSMNKLVTAQEYANISYREHTQIIETIAKGDYDEACVLMGEHIKRSMNSMLMNFAKEGVKAP